MVAEVLFSEAFLIPRLPRLHGALNLFGVLGQHLDSAGLSRSL